jgi:hypothetical protein
VSLTIEQPLLMAYAIRLNSLRRFNVGLIFFIQRFKTGLGKSRLQLGRYQVGFPA